MRITSDQVAALAPDAAALAAGRKLVASNDWTGVGRSDRAAWGECRGSALYQVRADLADLATKCSCPSRKFPCKHGIALLLRIAERPPAAETEPAWVSDWLAKRAEVQTRREEKKDRPDAPADPAAQAKRAAKRHERILAGLDGLDLWMEDLVRGGFAAMPRQRPTVFETQAARLVDAQAPGLASRLRRIDPGEYGSASDAGAERILAGLGAIALLAHAYRRVDALDPPLAADVRQAVGFPVDLDDVAASGERVTDDWLVLGSVLDDDDRVRGQRTWLRGLSSGRDAMVLQFAAGGAPFGETFVPAARFAAELSFWPGAFPQRALVRGERGDPAPFTGRIPGHATLTAFLGTFAAALAKQPWLDRAACCLHDVTIGADLRSVSDRDGRRAELHGDSRWTLLAMSGASPVDVTGEWDGARLLPVVYGIGGRLVPAESTR